MRRTIWHIFIVAALALLASCQRRPIEQTMSLVHITVVEQDSIMNVTYGLPTKAVDPPEITADGFLLYCYKDDENGRQTGPYVMAVRGTDMSYDGWLSLESGEWTVMAATFDGTDIQTSITDIFEDGYA